MVDIEQDPLDNYTFLSIALKVVHGKIFCNTKKQKFNKQPILHCSKYVKD